MPKKKVNTDRSLAKAPTEQEVALSNAKTLEKQLQKATNEFQDVIITGSIADLSQLSWDLYDKFKKGEMPTYFQDEKELAEFHKIKMQETAIKLIGFLDFASTHILNSEKLNNASLREITLAMNAVSTMLSTIMGQPSVNVSHTHTHKLAKSKEELDRRVIENREHLESIDAEFEELSRENDIVDI